MIVFALGEEYQGATSAKWRSSRPCHTDQQLDSYPPTKTALGELRAPTYKTSVTQENNNSNNNTEKNHIRERRTASWGCITPSPCMDTAQLQGGTPSLEKVALAWRKRAE